MNFKENIRSLIHRIQLNVFDEHERIDPDLIKYLQSAQHLSLDQHQYDQAKLYLKILLEYSWEKLNTGIWQNVKDVYRYLYAYACYLDVLIDCMKFIESDDVQVKYTFTNGFSSGKSCFFIVEYC